MAARKRMILRMAIVVCGMAIAGGASAVHAQEVVAVGKGSYAQSPPPQAGQGAQEMVQRTFPLVTPTDRAIPTNKFWTDLLGGKPKGSLWTYPWRIDPRETGLELFFPQRWNSVGADLLCDYPLRVEGENFKAPELLIKDWGDWTLTFRMQQDAGHSLDVTVGEGMPCVWVEAEGVTMTLRVTRDARITNAAGTILPATATTDAFMISMDHRLYGVFVPKGTQVGHGADRLRLTCPPGHAFATICPLPNAAAMASFAKVAYAIPRDSRMEWAYDAAGGKVETTWTVKTEPLAAGAADVVMQGWLPHHYRDGAPEMKLDGPQYLSPRGPLKTAIGNGFVVGYDFEGFLPFLPAPQKLGLPHDFDAARMGTLLDAAAENPKYGDDTYWGGKDLLRFAQYMEMAKQLHHPSYEKLKGEGIHALEDWLTYTPGEEAHYFARYENWHAMVGFKDSYDSARFNDHHFHYGYFTFSGALLGMEDPEFLRDYGDMLRLVAKDYANYDRQDKRYPLFRTMDLWAGHSWAGGLGSPGGENQESTSEAMQSWMGLYLLGTVMKDAEMTAAGAMGYAMESRATMEYWLNSHGDILPPEYKHPIVGILWSGGQAYGTYFSGDPGWIYGIQCLPQSPGLDYLVRNGPAAQKLFDQMLALRKAKEGSDDLGTMGDLGNVLLSQASQVNPEWAAAQFDRLWDAKNANVRHHAGAGTAYYNLQSYRNLGVRNWAVHMSIPTSAAYTQARNGVTTYVAYNPGDAPATVEVTQEGKRLGSFLAPAHQLTTVTTLTP